MINKIKLLLAFTFIFITGISFAQEESSEPITEIFESTKIIDNQTTTSPTKGAMHLLIYHRFSKIDKLEDLYGIYGASNVVLSLDYGITDKWMVGFGTEKYSKLQEFKTKYAILQQTPGGMPVSLSFYGNATINGNKEEMFGDGYKFTDRLSYFGQFIVARQISEKFAVQFSPSYSHFNKVDSVFQNDAIGISLGARFKITDLFSVIAEYNHGLYLKTPIKHYQTEPKPGIGIGGQIATSTHAFQFFISSYDGIVNQKNYTFNQHDFTDGGIMAGFNITVKL